MFGDLCSVVRDRIDFSSGYCLLQTLESGLLCKYLLRPPSSLCCRALLHQHRWTRAGRDACHNAVQERMRLIIQVAR